MPHASHARFVGFSIPTFRETLHVGLRLSRPLRGLGSNTLTLAYEQIGRPEAVQLMFEASRRRVGLKAIDAGEDHAFPVVPLKRMTQWVVRASPFFVHHRIKSDRTMLFGKVEMTADGVMALDMASVVAVRRGSN